MALTVGRIGPAEVSAQQRLYPIAVGTGIDERFLEIAEVIGIRNPERPP